MKLEKVIEFVKQKTIKDVRGRKSGNLQVTLLLVSALIEKCADNLNVFAMQVCAILQQILSLTELPLCKSLVSTYGVLCRKLDNGLFSGDKQFVDMFSSLTQEMISVGQAQLSIDSTNSREWRIFALLTSRHVFNCLGFNLSLSLKFVSLCVPLLARAVSNTYTKEMLLSRLQGNLNVEQETMRPLMRTITVKSTATTKKVDAGAEDESLNDDDLGEEAFTGLNTLFNTLSSSQISEGVRAIENFCFKEKTIETHWGTTFLQTCASFIPVQLRFVALTTLLNKLNNISDNTTSESNQFVELEHVARYVLALVSSDFNMIGLATSDVISQFLNLEKRLFLELSNIFDESQLVRLSSIYSRCICDLSSHIYYFDQTRDSVEEIVAHIDSTLESASHENALQAKRFVLNLLETIFIILERLSKKANAIARHRGTLENLDLSLQLLTVAESYPSFTSSVSSKDVTQIQSKYLEVVLFYLKREVVLNNEQSADLQNEAPSPEGKLLTPNYNNYIENHDNIIEHIIHHAKNYYREPSFSLENEQKVAETLNTVLEITGVNFVRNFILSFDQWQLKDASSSLRARCKDTTAYLILLSSLAVLDQLYDTVLSTPLTDLSLRASIESDIKMRKSSGLWVSGSLEHEMSGKNGQKLSNKVTESSILDFFSTTELAQWIHSPSHLSMSRGVSRSEIVKTTEPTDANGGDSSIDNYYLVAPHSADNGLGLGSANDISSIYSGLLNGHCHLNGNGHFSAETSHITQNSAGTNDTTLATNQNQNRSMMVPRVQDLRHTVNGDDNDDHFLFHDQGHEPTQRGVVQRQIHTKNINLLLNGLYSADDAKVIV